MNHPAPRGTDALLAFAATLPQRAENLRGFFDHNARRRAMATTVQRELF